MNLPSPPLLNGKKFDIWSSRMRVYLRYVDTHVDVNDEARDTLALRLIQQALDESMLHKIAATKTFKEAMKILEAQFSERGSNHKETAVAVAEVEVEKKLEASVSQTEHKKFEISESHIAVKHVDVVEVDEEATTRAVLEEEVAIAATENESTAQEVTGQPSEVECVDEKLMKSKPKRVEVCEFASIDSNQPTIHSHEEQKAQGKYDEEILSDEELQILKDEINLIDELLNARIAEKEISVENNNVYVENKIEEDNSIAANKDEEDISMEAAKMIEEEGSHVAAKDEEKGDSFATAVEPAENEEMDEQDESCEDEKSIENIFEKWSLEEIRHYYRLMWQQATEDDNIILQHDEMKCEYTAQRVMGIMNQIEDETWQQAINEFENIDERTKPKELEEMKRKKVKMKKARKIAEFKVWSRKKKK